MGAHQIPQAHEPVDTFQLCERGKAYRKFNELRGKQEHTESIHWLRKKNLRQQRHRTLRCASQNSQRYRTRMNNQPSIHEGSYGEGTHDSS